MLCLTVTSDSVSISRSPSTTAVYTGDLLHLTCATRLNQAVDTAVRVTHLWTGPGGVVSSGSGVRVSTVTGSGREYSSRVTFTSLRSSHSGTYTCSSTVHGQSSSVFVEQGTTQTSSTTFNAGEVFQGSHLSSIVVLRLWKISCRVPFLPRPPIN